MVRYRVDTFTYDDFVLSGCTRLTDGQTDGQTDVDSRCDLTKLDAHKTIGYTLCTKLSSTAVLRYYLHAVYIRLFYWLLPVIEYLSHSHTNHHVRHVTRGRVFCRTLSRLQSILETSFSVCGLRARRINNANEHTYCPKVVP